MLLLTTAKGRKRKLSCYGSKSKNPGPSVHTVKVFKPNYVTIAHSDSDSDDEVVDVEHSSGDEFIIDQNSSASSNEQPCEKSVETQELQYLCDDSCNQDPSFHMRCLKELKE